MGSLQLSQPMYIEYTVCLYLFIVQHTYPFTPFLGGLLLKCLVILCLNWGGPLLGVMGPPTTRVGEVGISARLLVLPPLPLERAEDELLLLLMLVRLLILSWSM